MEWFVYREDFNARQIEKFNIFDHCSFNKEVKELKEKEFSKDEFSEELRHIVMYYFWSKCEYEVIITSWPPYVKDNEIQIGEKIDVYDQIRMNWERFVDYVFAWSV